MLSQDKAPDRCDRRREETRRTCVKCWLTRDRPAQFGLHVTSARRRSLSTKSPLLAVGDQPPMWLAGGGGDVLLEREGRI